MADNDKDRPDQTLADYVGIAIGPVLVMTLVGSLVLFLLEVCYSGDYVGRMRWTLFFYVSGIVLVCRISMLPDISDRSWLYGIFLAGGTWLCLQGFVDYPHGTLIWDLSPVINLALIAIVWWSASKLVRDCTNVDEDTDMSGEGLLQASGLDRDGTSGTDTDPRPGEEATTATGIVAWWERYQHYRRKTERKRTLGVWVIYFSLAALPLFGLGQTLIPAADLERRTASFWFLAIYVASGLGLLMTTCFLGLRRYLRQRRLRMPAAMTGVWLVCGLILIVTLLGVAAVIPRPQAGYALFNFENLTGREKSASNYTVKGDSPGKGGGRSGDASKEPDADSKSGNGKGDKGKSQEKSEGKSSGEKKGESDSGGSRGEGKKGAGKEKGQNGESGKDGKDGGAKSDDRSKQSSSQNDREKSESSPQQRSGSSPEIIPKHVANILKWIVFAVVGIVTLGVVLFAIIRFLANFTGWAARFLEAWSRFWAQLFGPRKQKQRQEAAPAVALAASRPRRPFSSYHNPFRLGQHWTPFEFCVYTFSAFEAWARERGVDRLPGETPIEHAERVGEEVPDVETHARRLALIYARGVYGSSELPAAVNDVLRQVWDHLESGAESAAALK